MLSLFRFCVFISLFANVLYLSLCLLLSLSLRMFPLFGYCVLFVSLSTCAFLCKLKVASDNFPDIPKTIAFGHKLKVKKCRHNIWRGVTICSFLWYWHLKFRSLSPLHESKIGLVVCDGIQLNEFLLPMSLPTLLDLL